jgi:HemY protein
MICILRLLLNLAAAVTLAVVAAWLAAQPGQVVLNWQGWQVETSVAIVAVLAVLGFMLVWFAVGLVRRLFDLPGSWSLRRSEKRRLAGYGAFARGMVALAAGDARAAHVAARDAERLLPDGALHLLLGAQAAQLNGDVAGAKQRFTALRDNPQTRLLALRGLHAVALADGQPAVARDLAREAAALNANATWPLTALLNGDVAAHDWPAALRTMAQANKAKALPAAESAAHEAALLTEQARALLDNDANAARQAAERALKLRPGFAPAAITLAAAHDRAGKAAKADGVLRTAWAAAPHPDLIAAWHHVHRDLSPAERLTRLDAFVGRVWSDDPAACRALASAALAAGDLVRARSELDRAGEPDAEACALYARLDDQQYGDPQAARQWLDRERRAEPSPRWVCAACAHATPHWSAACPACGALDRLSWQRATPPRPAAPPPLDLPALPPPVV